MKRSYCIIFFVTFFLFNICPITAGEVVKQQVNPFHADTFQLQSGRSEQEDRAAIHYFNYKGQAGIVAAVFDGHTGIRRDGYKAALYLQQNFGHQFIKNITTNNGIQSALEQTFKDMHAYFEDESRRHNYTNIGSTGIVTVAVGHTCWMANLGDSRGYVKIKEGFFATEDHLYSTNEKEFEFAKSTGAVFTEDYDSVKKMQILRLNAGLMISRAFGDYCYKSIEKPQNNGTSTIINPMNNNPDITQLTIERNAYILLGCDGFFDAVKNEEVDGLIEEAVALSSTPEKFTKKYPNDINPSFQNDDNYKVFFDPTDTTETRVAKLLTYYAVCHKRSRDNTTVVFIQRDGSVDVVPLKSSWLSFQILKSFYVLVPLGMALGFAIVVLLNRHQMR